MPVEKRTATKFGQICCRACGVHLRHCQCFHLLGNTFSRRLIFATCGWNATAKAWIDENKNQVWDENELPLSKVEIFINQSETIQGKTIVLEKIGSTAVTDYRGITEISSLVTCGGHVVSDIYAKPPDGYISTTPELISMETSPHNKVFIFGFIKE